MRPLQKHLLGLIALTSLAASVAAAQHPVALIHEKVNDNQLTMLRGNTPPAANARNDMGRVSGSMPMTDLILVLRRSPEMQAAFDSFLESQYDPNSPNFHQWLTPEQVGEKFGPALSDISTVSAWLTSHGLSVDEVSKDRMTIRFSGSARQVEATFHTELHKLTVKGEAHFSNMSDPQIPMALDPVVLGPKALHNFMPRPLHRLGAKATLNPSTGHWERQTGAGSTPSPSAAGLRALPQFGLTGGTPPNTYQVEDVSPFDFATIYNVLPVWNSSIDGTGQTIAVVGTSDVKQSDVSSFKSTFGLPAGLSLMTKLAHGTDPGNCTSQQAPSSTNHWCTLDDQIENALDVEWSGALAPGAQVVLVVSGANSASDDTVFDSAQYAIQNNVAKIVNVSYGLCELGLGTSGNASYSGLWSTAATQGIAVFVASGDSGSPACDQGGDSAGTPYAAQYGLSVSGIASTPYNTAVGGTDLDWGNSASPYWSSTNNTSNGSSALGYMPEVTWNDSCTNAILLPTLQSLASSLRKAGYASAASPTDAESACNFVVNWNSTIKSLGGGDFSFVVDTVGAGGGKSNCTTNDSSTVASCTGGYAKPSWQTGVSGIPPDGKRDIPDVSFFASNGFLGSAYLICVSDWGACVTKSATTEPSSQEIGGTSAATPAMAGIMALINQKAGSTQGNPNSALYAIAATQNYGNCKSESVTNSGACYFNDVDSGTISMPCAAGSPDCTVSTSGDTVGVLKGYDAGAGYDLATGLGSLNVANVVNHWNSAIGTASSTVTVAPAASTITANTSLSVTVTVAGGSGTPTGTVTLAGGGYTSSSQTLASGSATFNIPGNKLSVGSVTLTANYGGDGTYAANTGTANITVNAAPVATVTVSPASASINSGQSLSVPVTVAGANGTPTGTVTLKSGSYTSSAQTLASGAATIAIPANSLSAGTATLTVTYSGDSNYGVSTGTANVTVTQSTYTLAATTPAAISRGSSATSTITFATTNDYSAGISLTSCTLNAGSPTNLSADTPTCTVATAVSGSTLGTATVKTKAATTAALQKPHVGGWLNAGSGAVLALLVFFGIPARQRGWRAMVGMLVIMFALGALSACGGGGGSTGGGGNGGGTSDPGTASGAYTFTVKTTGADPAATTATTTFTVTVN